MDIERFLLEDLIRWKNSTNRKPLILKGVRQCGKTWLLQRFGQQNFTDVAYFNFEKDKQLSSFFAEAYEPAQILMNLSAYNRRDIHPQKTLIIFDEIQTCPRALNSLKYFCEEAPQYAIAAAGSLLGISLASTEGFPVGKVDFLELTPCSFKEYLHSIDPMLEKHISRTPLVSIADAFAIRLSGYLKEYMTFGGMPAVLSTFITTRSIDETEKVLSEILTSYESDFSKHVQRKDIAKLFLLWRSIPVQFGRENGKFIYGEVRSGARAKDFEDALQWLINASMVTQVKQVQIPELPLRANEERKIFKLYVSDVGILRRLAELPPEVILNSQNIFADFKGHFAENYVVQQLRSMGVSPISYWSNPTGRAEVDFLIQDKMDVVPIETKSGLNLQAQSLKVYREKYKPAIAVRTSMQNLRLDNGLLNIPLYLLGEFPRLLELARWQIQNN